MDCRSTFKTNILIFYLKRNAGWICPLVDSYQRACAFGCWVYKFVFKVEIKLRLFLKSAIFYLTLKKKIVDRKIKKNKDDNANDYNRWYNREKINKMTEQTVYWKVNLVFLENNLQ